MSQEPLCKVCRKPLDDHALILEYGVAHAGSYDADGRFRDCSAHDCDVHYIWGELAALRSFVRSLRWHAGRLSRTGDQWGLDDLLGRVDKCESEIKRKSRALERYYAWSRKR